MPAGNSHMRLRSVPKGPSWCQPKQMVEGLCYINERSPRHWRYLSSWQFTSLLRTYQSCPIIFIELSCHLHCQKHSFFNILKARPTSAGGDYDTLTHQGRWWQVPQWLWHYCKLVYRAQSNVLKQKPSGMRKKNIKAGLSFTHSICKYISSSQTASLAPYCIPVRLLCLHGC